jgi:hypothetical protein
VFKRTPVVAEVVVAVSEVVVVEVVAPEKV